MAEAVSSCPTGCEKEVDAEFYRHPDSIAVGSAPGCRAPTALEQQRSISQLSRCGAGTAPRIPAPGSARPRSEILFARTRRCVRKTIRFHGVAWKRAISRYIEVMLPGDNGPWPIAWQTMCAGSSPAIAVTSAMTAKVGLAARCSQPPIVARSRGLFLRVFIVPAPPDAACLIAAVRRAIEPLVRTPQAVQPARVGRIGVVHVRVVQDERAHPGQFAQVGSSIHTARFRELVGRVRYRA